MQLNGHIRLDRGSVLDLLLFRIFIDDLTEEVFCEISKLADGKKNILIIYDQCKGLYNN